MASLLRSESERDEDGNQSKSSEEETGSESEIAAQICCRGRMCGGDRDHELLPGGSEGDSDHHDNVPRKMVKRARHEALRAMIVVNQDFPFQTDFFDFYHNECTELAVAGFIVVNFVLMCMQRQYCPDIDAVDPIWQHIATFFNAAFLVELLVNAYGYGCTHCSKFLSSPWNIFDIVVVSVGTMDLLGIPYPSQLLMLRMLRAFRIFRLFGRVESLRKIIASLIKALPGVMNSFLIVIIMMCVYSVLSVDLFGMAWCDTHGDPVSYLREDGAEIEYETPRGKCFGQDYYGDFLSAFYTMFQIMTGESWSEGAVRPLLETCDTTRNKVFVMMFFISFILLTSIVLLNVVVAVLVNDYSAGASEEPEPDEKAEGTEAPPPPPTLVDLDKQADAILEKLAGLTRGSGA